MTEMSDLCYLRKPQTRVFRRGPYSVRSGNIVYTRVSKLKKILVGIEPRLLINL